MFWRKKHEAQDKALAEKRVSMLAYFDTRLAQAEALDDPGEKILQLKKLGDDLDKTVRNEVTNRDDDTFSRGFRNGGLFFLGSTTGIIALTVSFHVPFLWLAIVPSIIGSFKIGDRSRDRMEDRLYKRDAEYFSGLSARQKKVSGLSDDLVQTHWASMAKSKKAQEIFQAVPQLREKYATAFCKSVADGQIPITSPAQERQAANDQQAEAATVLDKPIVVSHQLQLKKPAPPQ